MVIEHLWLTDFRSYRSAELRLAEGVTAVVGANGQGKTNLLEAIAWLATMSSFRGVPSEVLVREGADQAIVRAEGRRAERSLLIEAEIPRAGRTRVLLNRQRLNRSRDLLGALRVSVFSPEDLALVKGGPAGRRDFLDDTLVALHPRHDVLRSDLERVLRQRGALLKQCGPGARGFDESAAFTLDVWDAKLTEAGEALAAARETLAVRLEPLVAEAYVTISGDAAAEVGLRVVSPWREHGLAAALAASRRDDLRRGTTLVGPHRDELELRLDRRPARTHASQGEQRSLALALRLAAHRAVMDEIGSPPVLLLDDVFSELDPARSEALLHALPPGQTVLTTAGILPPGATPDRVVHVADGRLDPA